MMAGRNGFDWGWNRLGLKWLIAMTVLAGMGLFWGKSFPPAAHSAPQATVLKVGVLEDSPPYDYYDGNNHLVGMNIEIVKEVGRRLGMPVQLEITTYNRVVMGLLFHQYDMIAAPQSVSTYRKKVVRFTKPYLVSSDVLVSQCDHAPVNKLADLTLDNLKVGVFNGTSYPQLLHEHHMDHRMVLYPTQREMFFAFLNGKIPVMMMDEQIARYYSKRQGLPFRVSHERVRIQKEMAFSVRKEDESLANRVDQALAEMEDDGTLARIRRQWLGTVRVAQEGTP
jgi:ABC-type amino acid transport substrate-binding protein